MNNTITLQQLFAQTSSINELLEQIGEMQLRGIKYLNGPYFSSVDLDLILKVVNELKIDYSKEEIYKSIVFISTGY